MVEENLFLTKQNGANDDGAKQRREMMSATKKSVEELQKAINAMKAARDAAVGVPKFMQLNGFLTFPKGLHKDLVGQLAKGTITVELNAIVMESKSGNASIRLTAKIPETALEFHPLTEVEEMELELKELRRALRKASDGEEKVGEGSDSLLDELK